MLQCPKCGNREVFDIDTIYARRTIVVTQTAEHIAHGGYLKGHYILEAALHLAPTENLCEMNDQSECTCMGAIDAEGELDYEGCGYTGPLHTFYFEPGVPDGYQTAFVFSGRHWHVTIEPPATPTSEMAEQYEKKALWEIYRQIRIHLDLGEEAPSPLLSEP